MLQSLHTTDTTRGIYLPFQWCSTGRDVRDEEPELPRGVRLKVGWVDRTGYHVGIHEVNCPGVSGVETCGVTNPKSTESFNPFTSPPRSKGPASGTSAPSASRVPNTAVNGVSPRSKSMSSHHPS